MYSIFSLYYTSLQESEENPQLNMLFEKKCWDAVILVLDNCKSETSYDFAKLDPPFVDINKHPLMLVAQSGQETILKHATVQKLLELKWRFIPRLAFYANLVFYMCFLCLFAAFSIRLSKHIIKPSNLVFFTPQQTWVFVKSILTPLVN